MFIQEEILGCVTFILYKDLEGEFHHVGTGFFIGEYVKEVDSTLIYVVTAKHIIGGIKVRKNDGYVYLKMNFKEGGTRLTSTVLEDWEYHDSDPFADVAVFFGAPKTNFYKYIGLSLEKFAKHDQMDKLEIGTGDDVFILGLFNNHLGKNRILPILRKGSIAMMPSEPVQALLGDRKVSMEAYLVECMSTGGLSGSPVFVIIRSSKSISLLGVVQGHWVQAELGDRTFKEEIHNKGIAIVTPIEKVLEIIRQEKISSLRKNIIERK